MTPAQEEAKRRAEVMLAFSEGKEIEVSYHLSRTWHSTNPPTWDFGRCNYRIKPELRKPRFFYLKVRADGALDFSQAYCVEGAISMEKDGVKLAEFIEVIKEEQA